MKLGTWLLSLMQPLLGRILASLGFSVVTITGFNVSINALRSQWTTAMGGLPADMLNVFLLSGGGVAAGMILGAVTTRITLWMIQNSVKVLGVNPG